MLKSTGVENAEYFLLYWQVYLHPTLLRMVLVYAFYPGPLHSQKCPSLEEMHIYRIFYIYFNNHMAPDNSEIKEF